MPADRRAVGACEGACEGAGGPRGEAHHDVARIGNHGDRPRDDVTPGCLQQPHDVQPPQRRVRPRRSPPLDMGLVHARGGGGGGRRAPRQHPDAVLFVAAVELRPRQPVRRQAAAAGVYSTAGSSARRPSCLDCAAVRHTCSM
jgi:hypothetical protein